MVVNDLQSRRTRRAEALPSVLASVDAHSRFEPGGGGFERVVRLRPCLVMVRSEVMATYFSHVSELFARVHVHVGCHGEAYLSHVCVETYRLVVST